MIPVLALTERLLRYGIRNLDIVFAVLAPVLAFVGLNIALRDVIDTGSMEYAQYVLPAVAVQAMLFGALNTADLAASERTSGFGVRLRTLPISIHAPLMARMSYCLLRGALALLAVFAVAYPFGFRLDRGLTWAIPFVVVSLVLTLALSLGADAAGAAAKNSDTSSQLLLVPQLLLVLMSTGMAPLESFPTWVQPVVHYQPISQICETLRNFTLGQVSAANLSVTVAWCVVLLMSLGWLALREQRIRG